MFLFPLFSIKQLHSSGQFKQFLSHSRTDQARPVRLALKHLTFGLKGAGLICHSSFGDITLTQNSTNHWWLASITLILT